MQLLDVTLQKVNEMCPVWFIAAHVSEGVGDGSCGEYLEFAGTRHCSAGSLCKCSLSLSSDFVCPFSENRYK